MPLFEFRCADCSAEFEELVLGQALEVVCPKCRSTRTEKLLSACRHKCAGSGPNYSAATPGSYAGGGGCSGCSGGSCATCK